VADFDLEHAPMAALELAAREVMGTNGWGYYSTGARDERTLRENEAAWEAWWWRPRRLTGSWETSIATTFLGRPSPHPLIVGPSAAHRLAHPQGELATAWAVAALGGTMILSTSSTVAVEDVAAVPGLDLWFQVYPFEDAQATDSLIGRAVDAGVRAIVLTVDVTHDADVSARPVGGFQGHDVAYAHHSGHVQVLRHMDWAWAERLAARWGRPVLLKGILHPDDARQAAERGFAGIVVSNHGGRKLDGSMPSALALPACVEAVGGRAEVYVDGGIRRGGHALVGLALGARGVLVARPILWGLALGGTDGVRTVLGRLVRELAEDAALADIRDVTAIDRGILVPVSGAQGWLHAP